ncbi:XRE family transcriptional regulator [Kineosporia sp. R_H_3]|uniref:XRE family transcriptional regulator n=1 Tax=Kineosporia sp. R_H_3 TaxID=1961848 RepID=UPI0018EA1A8B
MSGRGSWKELRSRTLGPDVEQRPGYRAARQRIETELAEHAKTLGDLRRARSFTQRSLATSLGVSQAQVSRIENQADLYLSTLRSYVEAMGGQLEFRVRFPDASDAVEVTVGEVTGSRPSTPEVGRVGDAGASSGDHDPLRSTGAIGDAHVEALIKKVVMIVGTGALQSPTQRVSRVHSGPAGGIDTDRVSDMAQINAVFEELIQNV